MPKRQKILLVILIVVVIIFIYMTYFSGPSTSVNPGNTMIGQPPTAQQAQQNAARMQQRAASAADAGSQNAQAAASKPMAVFEGNWGSRDPFYRKVIKRVERIIEEKSQELNLILSGIQIAGGKTIAVINNDIYREGDVVAGKKIAKIEKDYVVLRDNNNEYILKLGGKNE